MTAARSMNAAIAALGSAFVSTINSPTATPQSWIATRQVDQSQTEGCVTCGYGCPP
jgi:hypothetical protein